MTEQFTFSAFLKQFATDEHCLEIIKKFRYPKGITCLSCKKITRHYRVKNRSAFVCKICRSQTYPMSGTIFEKSTTPLRIWFYAMYLMTLTKGTLSIKQLQKELDVTYKTAWRIYKNLYQLMEQNSGDLLVKAKEETLHKWIFFNKFEIKVVEKQTPDEV